MLIDRIWSRKLSKERVRIDTWMNGIAPNDDARAWFAHDEEKWYGFKEGRLNLLFSSKNESHNNAVALREYLLKQPG